MKTQRLVKVLSVVLPHPLQIKIQGQVGEMVALGYSLEQLDTEVGDEVIIDYKVPKEITVWEDVY